MDTLRIDTCAHECAADDYHARPLNPPADPDPKALERLLGRDPTEEESARFARTYSDTMQNLTDRPPR